MIKNKNITFEFTYSWQQVFYYFFAHLQKLNWTCIYIVIGIGVCVYSMSMHASLYECSVTSKALLCKWRGKGKWKWKGRGRIHPTVAKCVCVRARLSLAFKRSHFGKSLDWINRFLPFALIAMPPPASLGPNANPNQPLDISVYVCVCVCAMVKGKWLRNPLLLSPCSSQVLQFDLWLTWVEKLHYSWRAWRLEVGIA